MDALDIDISIASIWTAWQAFARGKRSAPALLQFRSCLETNLLDLANDLAADNYQHAGYESFVVHDPKRREIAVASVRDRIVHRLLYDYLVQIWDKSFCYDAWSCRKGKGLGGAIDRAQAHSQSYRAGWFWRSDIRKFFDSIDQATLCFLLRTKISGQRAQNLLDNVIASYETILAS